MNTQRNASFAVLAMAWMSLAARAQEPETSPPPPPVAPKPTTPVRIQAQPDDVQRQMVELFGKVERELRAIDRLLQEASRAPAAGESGSLAEQLRNAQASSESVQKDIDRILELAASQSPNSSSSSSGGGQSQTGGGQGENPMDRQGEQSTGRESTPSMPEQGGEKPKPGDGQPGGEQKKPGSEKPGEKPGEKSGEGQKKPGEQGRQPSDGPQASKAEPQQQPGSDPARGSQGSGTQTSDARDRWGDLPMHAREVFRNEGGRDMPPLYREWIDAYYKRLNKKP
ncbi:MAG: hypothetical protein NTY35_10615 [Planctomycetota bacterium]|nr:hypothetical protein [Planctomycetota bacterium]